MHLWPSLRIRDSFKHAYLVKVEWNLDRMKRAQSSSVTKAGEDRLLDDSPSKPNAIVSILRDLSICFFCCCASHDVEEH